MYLTGKEASVSKLILSLKYGGITLKGQFTDRFFSSKFYISSVLLSFMLQHKWTKRNLRFCIRSSSLEFLLWPFVGVTFRDHDFSSRLKIANWLNPRYGCFNVIDVKFIWTQLWDGLRYVNKTLCIKEMEISRENENFLVSKDNVVMYGWGREICFSNTDNGQITT